MMTSITLFLYKRRNIRGVQAYLFQFLPNITKTLS